MLVYARRTMQEPRPAWVIGTRLVTFAVTAALVWPHRSGSQAQEIALLAYALLTILTLASLTFSKRFRLKRLSVIALTLQIAVELVVISIIVYSTGGMRSPYNSLYLMTIISAALSFRLVGTLLIATAASGAFVAAVWADTGAHARDLLSPDVLSALGQLSDEDFYTVFLRLCVFFLCAFAGGYLAERLYSKDEALAHTSEALKSAKFETSDILKHLRSGVLTIDMTGRIVYFNRSAEEILGLAEKKIRGLSLREGIGAIHPELADRLDWVLATRQMDSRMELIVHRADGQRLPVGISTSMLSGSNGQPRGVVAVFADLTEVKQFEEKIRRQDRLAAIGELSAGIAHEIRNPLAAISGSVEVLRNDLDVSGENAQLLNLVISETSRLNKILSDFLLFARMSPVVTGRVSVAAVLDEVFEITRRHFHHLGGNPLNLKSDHKNGALMVEADVDHLKQILINLVFNGIEACAPDHRSVTVTVRGESTLPIDLAKGQESDGRWVSISVRDTGSGIAEHVLERLYEPFVSTKSAGTGLGLAVVRRLLDNCGGRIAVESQAGEGTTFVVYFKRCPTTMPEPALRSAL